MAPRLLPRRPARVARSLRDAVTGACAAASATTDAVATDALATDAAATDEPESVAIEMPKDYIAFEVWTDAAGHGHVITTGLQDHPVTAPVCDTTYEPVSSYTARRGLNSTKRRVAGQGVARPPGVPAAQWGTGFGGGGRVR